MRKNLNTKQLEQVEALFKHYGRVEISRTEINNFAKTGEIANPNWLKTDEYKVSRGIYSLPIEGNDFSPSLTDVPLVPEEPKEPVVSQAAFVVSSLVGNIVPDKDPVFVPWGSFKDIKKIVDSIDYFTTLFLRDFVKVHPVVKIPEYLVSHQLRTQRVAVPSLTFNSFEIRLKLQPSFLRAFAFSISFLRDSASKLLRGFKSVLPTGRPPFRFGFI